MNKAILYIQNMRCNGCKKSIFSALEDIAGVSNLIVFPAKGELRFNYKNQDAIEAVRVVLHNMGYPQEGTPNSIRSKVKSLNNCLIGKLS